MTPRAPALSPEDRRASLVEVTIPLLREHGAAMTTRQVAEAAGIAEGTVFRAFGSKDELVAGLCRSGVRHLRRARRSCARIDRALPLDDRLVAAVDGHAGPGRADHRGDVVAAVVRRMPPHATSPSRHRAPTPRSTPPSPTSSVTTRPRCACPPEDVVDCLSHLTLSSVHPLLPGPVA